jgi:hypothetical protein
VVVRVAKEELTADVVAKMATTMTAREPAKKAAGVAVRLAIRVAVEELTVEVAAKMTV